MAQKRPVSSIEADKSDTNVFISDTIDDRKSTFIAYYSPTVSVKTLQATPALKTASHRISAWRTPSPQKTLGGKRIFTSGSDDDGEQYAGKKLEKVLNELEVEGSVVVARWYGGVLLGPIRFTHIENVAKEAIARARAGTSGQESKKPKLETSSQADDLAEKQRLAKQLSDRDRSIVTLRQLLTDKQSATKQADKSAAPTTQPNLTPSSTPDYLAMSLVRLKQLDRARDATIAWILKQIDAVEEAGATASTEDG